MKIFAVLASVVGGILFLLILGGWIALQLAALGWLVPDTPDVPREKLGEFPSTPKIEMLADGREAKLLEDFVFIDPNKKAWIAPKNSIINGASIPQTFWTVIGSPFTGQYRNASIVHDVGCERMTDSWESVHLMFYQACRCGGVPEDKAKTLYTAVYRFGPRWEIKQLSEVRTFTTPTGEERSETVTVEVPEILVMNEMPKPDLADKLEAYIRQNDPSLEQLQILDLDAL